MNAGTGNTREKYGALACSSVRHFIHEFKGGHMLNFDGSALRGVNYPFPADEERMRRELSYGRRVNLNAIRFWMNFRTWEKDPDYLAKTVKSVRIAYECGYRTMPILFNGNGENSASIPDEKRPDMLRYAEETVNALKNEPGLLLWDAMNEPLCNWWISRCNDESEKAERKGRVWTFLKEVIPVIRRNDPDHPITVGYTTAWEIEDSVLSLCDVLSFHDYSPTRARMNANFDLTEEWGRKYGLPVIQTETGCLARANPYDMVLEECRKRNMGWFLFELMIHGRCDSEHGIFYPDGTVRDPSTVAAMMGCFRCRDPKVAVLPVPNREGQAARAVEAVRNALAEYTDDAFDYRPSDLDKLFNAAEYAANLLECCEMVPMIEPPTAKIMAWRRESAEGNRPPLSEVRAFAYSLALRLKEVCQIL